MDIYVLDKNLNILSIEDCYESLLWNERFQSPGDIEWIIPISSRSVASITEDCYIWQSLSDNMMIIEGHQPYTNSEDGDSIIFTGRSLESILDRRIIWNQTTISGNAQEAIKKLINEAIINPTITVRKIPNFIFEDSTDPAITGLTINEMQFTGDNLLEAIQFICKLLKIGFKIRINTSNQFVFKLFAGIDRTKRQVVTPQIEFSRNNDNLFTSKLRVNKSNYKNITLIAGEGEGLSRKTAVYPINTEEQASGLDRRELFTDARDISSNEGYEDAIPQSEYTKLLQERGKQKLEEYIITREVDAEVDTSEYAMYKFNKDYFVGDLVENVDIFGTRSVSRITEMTLSITGNEFKYYPIFENEEILT